MNKHRFISNARGVLVSETITPQEAQEILTNWNKRNRPIQKSLVKKYAAAMTNGTWDNEAPNTLQFDSNGILVNGQHTLSACVASGIPLVITIWVGLNPKTAVLYSDGNKPRSAWTRIGIMLSENTFAKSDYERAKFAVPIAKMWHWAERQFKKPSNDDTEMAQFLVAKEETLTELSLVNTKREFRRAGFNAACATFLEKNPEKAKEFMGKVLTGADCIQDSPELKIRNYFLTEALNGGQRQQREDYGRTVFAIHKFIKGESLPRFSTQEQWEF
jgi:hypothetical protein